MSTSISYLLYDYTLKDLYVYGEIVPLSSLKLSQCHVIYRVPFNHKTLELHFEGSRPEWCMSSMIYSTDIPFWSETLDLSNKRKLSLHEFNGYYCENLNCIITFIWILMWKFKLFLFAPFLSFWLAFCKMCRKCAQHIWCCFVPYKTRPPSWCSGQVSGLRGRDQGVEPPFTQSSHTSDFFQYRDHITNEEVKARIGNAIGPFEDLLTSVKRRKLKWYGHVTRSSGLAKTILQGTVQGGRRRGRQRKWWEDNIKEWTGLEWNIILRKAENHEEWSKLVVESTVVPQQSARLRDR